MRRDETFMTSLNRKSCVFRHAIAAVGFMVSLLLP